MTIDFSHLLAEGIPREFPFCTPTVDVHRGGGGCLVLFMSQQDQELFARILQAQHTCTYPQAIFKWHGMSAFYDNIIMTLL